MTNLEKLTAFIQKKCPELMELSFGCRFISEAEWGGRDELFVLSLYDDTGRTKTLSYIPVGGDIQYEINNFEEFDGDFQILGHSITIDFLADLI